MQIIEYRRAALDPLLVRSGDGQCADYRGDAGRFRAANFPSLRSMSCTISAMAFSAALVHGDRQADRVACHPFRLRGADGDRLGNSDH